MDRKIDGVYGQALTDVFKTLAIDPAKAPSIDRNVLAWVAAKVPPDLTSCHVIDWGAGTGRFVPLFNVRGAEWITLVEPSESNVRVLSKLERYGLNIKQGCLGNIVARERPPEQTLHLAVFVLNCIQNPAEAIASLLESTKPGRNCEKLGI